MSTKTTLDFECVPHIGDSIFAEASTRTLVHMRSVCRLWRERADRVLSGHVTLKVEDVSTEWRWLHPGEARYKYDRNGESEHQLQELHVTLVSKRDCAVRAVLAMAVDGRTTPASPPRGLQLGAIRVLDIEPKHNRWFTSVYSRLPAFASQPSDPAQRVDRTVRFTWLEGVMPDVPLQISKVVLFAHNATPRYGAEAYLVHLARLNPAGPTKAVLHVRQPRAMSLPWPCSVDGVNEVTVFVHPWAQLAVTNHSLSQAVHQTLGTLIDILQAVQRTVKSITVVGFETLKVGCLGLSELHDLGEENVKLSNAVRAALDAMPVRSTVVHACAWRRRLYPKPLHVPVATVVTVSTRYPVEFVSVTDYRRRIGELQFRVETKEGALW